ncbi:MAG: HEAT repeat domain-containing protein [Acidobacteria bacterium]|nr:HEAT repeat domain-containing protein [Acidobacteriota bacterium]
MKIALLLLMVSLAPAQTLERYEYGQSRQALTDLETQIRAALGSPEKLRVWEVRFIALLGSNATLAAKDFACRQLSLIGTEASVPALEKLLTVKETADMARYALARIRGARGAEKETDPFQRAEQLLAAGDKTAAAGIYRRLCAPRETEAVRVAALRGLAANAPSEALPQARQWLEKGKPRMQAAAIQILGAMRGNAATEILVEDLPALPVSAQVQAIAALAARGDAAARPALARAWKSPRAEVRIAALEGLGSLGDTSSVTLLAEAAATASGAEQAAARESLARLGGPGIDAVVTAGIRKSTGRRKAEYVRAAGERATASSADALLAAAGDSDSEVRREALRALRDTAGAGHVPALAGLVAAAGLASERQEAERTLASVLRRVERPDAAPLVAADRSASQPGAQASLLMAMALGGLGDALPLSREALASSDDAQRRAAILALSEWPDTAPARDLLAVAQGDRNSALQVLALRGYLKLLALPSGRTPAKSAVLLAEALKIARQAGEKRAVLAALQRAPSPEALAAAESALNDPEAGAEARLAVDALRKALAPRK